MYSKLIITALCLTFLAACAKQASKTPSSPGNPALLHHSQDTKGSNLFPEQRVATGKRVFISTW